MSTRGSALIDVLVALVILTSVGVSTLGYVASVIDAEERAQSREALQLRAERVLAATALLSRQDLNLRLGERAVGGFIVSVNRPEPALYRIAVSSEATASSEELVTVVFRPDPETIEP